ncbi:hypothetical protein HMPREF0322_04293 [Desulfitobacterium hafniense DP7]|uniref:Uncharacterized protein n=1 Tax=Desulfitobacterium hafniense DP7 TaxID=537010 RepID=G9XTI6_DESHA|nr:hypothetical protein HMPREF0322_04293 [Desulfitobacterium hafniense DP7]
MYAQGGSAVTGFAEKDRQIVSGAWLDTPLKKACQIRIRIRI